MLYYGTERLDVRSHYSDDFANVNSQDVKLLRLFILILLLQPFIPPTLAVSLPFSLCSILPLSLSISLCFISPSVSWQSIFIFITWHLLLLISGNMKAQGHDSSDLKIRVRCGKNHSSFLAIYVLHRRDCWKIDDEKNSLMSYRRANS